MRDAAASLSAPVAALLGGVLAVGDRRSASAHGSDRHGHAVAPDSLRAPLTRENFYFVMADRFDNGDTANDRGGLTAAARSRASTRPARAGTTAAT